MAHLARIDGGQYESRYPGNLQDGASRTQIAFWDRTRGCCLAMITRSNLHFRRASSLMYTPKSALHGSGKR